MSICRRPARWSSAGRPWGEAAFWVFVPTLRSTKEGVVDEAALVQGNGKKKAKSQNCSGIRDAGVGARLRIESTAGGPAGVDKYLH